MHWEDTFHQLGLNTVRFRNLLALTKVAKANFTLSKTLNLFYNIQRRMMQKAVHPDVCKNATLLDSYCQHPEEKQISARSAIMKK